jgi:hypothetical protein
MNSILQVLFTVSEFKDVYFDHAVDTFGRAPANPTEAFDAQMFVVGLFIRFIWISFHDCCLPSLVPFNRCL